MLQMMQRKLIIATVVGISVIGMTATNVPPVSEAQAFGLGDLNPVKGAKKVGGAVKKGAKAVGSAAKGTAKAKGTITDRLKQAGGAIKNGAKKVGSGAKKVAKTGARAGKLAVHGAGILAGSAAVGTIWGAGVAVQGAGKLIQSKSLEELGKGATNLCLGNGNTFGCVSRVGQAVLTGGQSEVLKAQGRAAKAVGKVLVKSAKCVAGKASCGKIGDPPANARIRNLGAAKATTLTKAVTRGAPRPTSAKTKKLSVRTDQIRCVRAPCPGNAKQAKRPKLNLDNKQIRCVRAPCKFGGANNRGSKSQARDHRRKTLADRNDRRRQVRTDRTRRNVKDRRNRRQVESRRTRRQVDGRHSRRDYRSHRSRRQFESRRSRRQVEHRYSRRQFGGQRNDWRSGRRR